MTQMVGPKPLGTLLATPMPGAGLRPQPAAAGMIPTMNTLLELGETPRTESQRSPAATQPQLPTLTRDGRDVPVTYCASFSSSGWGGVRMDRWPGALLQSQMAGI